MNSPRGQRFEILRYPTPLATINQITSQKEQGYLGLIRQNHR